MSPLQGRPLVSRGAAVPGGEGSQDVQQAGATGSPTVDLPAAAAVCQGVHAHVAPCSGFSDATRPHRRVSNRPPLDWKRKTRVFTVTWPYCLSHLGVDGSNPVGGRTEDSPHSIRAFVLIAMFCHKELALVYLKLPQTAGNASALQPFLTDAAMHHLGKISCNWLHGDH